MHIEKDSPSFTPYDFLSQQPKLLALPSDSVLPLLVPLAAGYDSTQHTLKPPEMTILESPILHSVSPQNLHNKLLSWERGKGFRENLVLPGAFENNVYAKFGG